MSRVALVTGAHGFIGRRLSFALSQSGVRVVAVGRARAVGPWEDEILADLRTGGLTLPRGFACDTVFHLAAKTHALSATADDEEEYRALNVRGTARVLEAARDAGASRFVFFSSVKAMGEGGPARLDESCPCAPTTAYGATKLEAEQLVLEKDHGMGATVLRLPLVYGPGAGGNLQRMLRATDRRRFPPISVNNRRSMVHVEDVVRAAVLVSDHPDSVSEVYIVTDGIAYSTTRIHEAMSKALGVAAPSFRVGPWALAPAAWIGDAFRRAFGRRFVIDSESLEKLVGSAWYSSDKLETQLGYRPQTTLERSLPEIVVRYRESTDAA